MAHIPNGTESIANELPKTDNPVLDELLRIMVRRFEVLVERGFLAPHFLSKMVQSPSEVIKFIRQNRSVVADTLNKRLNKKQRPTREDLERMGIVPQGYFNYGHDLAMKSKHRRKSSTGQDLEMMLKLRPQKEDIVRLGVIKKHEMEHGGYYELDETQLDEMMNEENEYYSENDVDSDDVAWEMSMLSSLLFKTISEALSKSCIDTQQQESIVLQEMIEMNNEMKSLRNVLDKYLLSSDISATIIHENDENMVREKFHSIQEKLLHISSRQNRIHEKLRILHSVERSMISLQNNYQIRLSALKRSETQVLRDLQQEKQRRDRAIKIMYAEKSHKSWAMTKLDYTINIASDYNAKRSSMKSDYDDDLELSDDIEFVAELEKFVNSLRNISEHQKVIVREFDSMIDNSESNLLSIRYDMSKVRDMTFKKIYDLHKQVQIAESLELGYRRLSVASATEIERERRHHNIKIQRQLNALNIEMKSFNYSAYESALKEIIDIQVIMSKAKLKAFFAVFVQTAAQSVVDIELTWNNLNSELPPIDGGRVTNMCNSLYGVESVLEKIESQRYIELNDKLNKCVVFINKIKRAIATQNEKENKNENKNKNNKKKKKIKTFKVNNVILCIARTLCVHCIEEIEKIDQEEIAKYAQSKSMQIFRRILNGAKIFKTDPISQMDAAKQVLQEIYGITMNDFVL